MTPALQKALNRFYYSTLWLHLFIMYYRNYPDVIGKADILKLCKDISGWKMIKRITLFNHPGLTGSEALKLQMFKHGALVSCLIWILKLKHFLRNVR